MGRYSSTEHLSLPADHLRATQRPRPRLPELLQLLHVHHLLGGRSRRLLQGQSHLLK